MITLEIALERILEKRRQPVITEYELYVELRRLYQQGTYESQRVRIRKQTPTFTDYYRVTNRLIQNRVLRPDEDFSKGADYLPSQYKIFRITAVSDGSADDVCALIDPFCYVSHLSAMQWHHLTNRFPDQLMLSTPAATLWRSQRDAKTASDYGETKDGEQLKTLEFINLPEKVRSRPVIRHETKYPSHYVASREAFARITKVGDTFEQTLDKPDWCGGMRHVLEVWDKHAKIFLEEIIAAIEKSARSIIKVRAGYILEERLGITDPRVEAWAQFAQRGGSRKLDPTTEYRPIYSEKWMISLNV
ncbi:MAG TPA: hypothetical protein VHZ78_01330 [Rhizomicrobium sp.]|jgi:predicted transcriptional regulator of viral defense system|nr:hypothetical protein [Rhizomicrobium sp.]